MTMRKKSIEEITAIFQFALEVREEAKRMGLNKKLVRDRYSVSDQLKDFVDVYALKEEKELLKMYEIGVKTAGCIIEARERVREKK